MLAILKNHAHTITVLASKIFIFWQFLLFYSTIYQFLTQSWGLHGGGVPFLFLKIILDYHF